MRGPKVHAMSSEVITAVNKAFLSYLIFSTATEMSVGCRGAKDIPTKKELTKTHVGLWEATRSATDRLNVKKPKTSTSLGEILLTHGASGPLTSKVPTA